MNEIGLPVEKRVQSHVSGGSAVPPGFQTQVEGNDLLLRVYKGAVGASGAVNVTVEMRSLGESSVVSLDKSSTTLAPVRDPSQTDAYDDFATSFSAAHADVTLVAGGYQRVTFDISGSTYLRISANGGGVRVNVTSTSNISPV